MNRIARATLLIAVLIAQLLHGLPSPVQASTQTMPRSLSQFLPGDEVVGGAASLQMAPAIARGGDLLLTAWTDKRAQPAGSGYVFETSDDIYAMRLDASGSPLDAIPFVVTQAPGAQENPQIVWNGSHWLVVFESIGISGTGGYYEKHLAAVRVAPDGSVLDAQPIQIFNTVPNITTWSVASDGVDWVVAFQGSAASNDLQAIKITAAGELLQPATALVPQTYYMRFSLRLSYAAGVYLLTWSDYSESMAIRFDQNLTLLDAAPFILTPGAVLNSLAANASQFYIVWHQQQPDYSIAVMGSRLDLAGTKLDGDGDNISVANEPQPYTTTSVAWDGTQWRVNWSHNNAVYAARVNTIGQVLDPGGIAIPGPTSGISAGTSLGGVQLVWEVDANYDKDIYSANISSANTPGPNTLLSTGAPMQIRSDAAVGSSGYMMVYRSDSASLNRVLAQPLDANGSPLTTEPVELDSGVAATAPGSPTVAWNGSLYLVAWSTSSGIVAQRIQQDGTLVDASPIAVMTAFGLVDVAAVGDVFLVGGLKFGTTPEVLYPIGARVRGSDGAVLDATPILIGTSYTRSIALTAFGSRWLAVSHATYTHDDSVGSTVGLFVESNGATGSVFSIYGPYSMGGNGIIEVAAASDGVTALVLQSVELTSGVETDLISRLVNSNGTLQPAVNLTPWAGNQYRGRAAWDGSQYVVVYNEQKNRFAPWTMDQIDARSDLYGMRITPAGAPIDPQGFAFSLSPAAEAFPNITAANGVSLLSGSVLRNPAPFGAYRIGYQRIGTNGNQPPVVVASSSSSGGDIPLPVTFSSSGSSDSDGTIAAYYWDFGDGSISSGANPSHTYTTPGNFVATLTITDNLGAQNTNALAIEASASNQIPVVVASAAPPAGPPPLDVVFSAAGSYDPDGYLGNFHWTFSDGSDYWGPTAYNTFYTAGVYTATLEAFDNRGATGTTSIQVYVGQPNQTPVAVAAADPPSGVAPLLVDFSSVGSHDPDGTIASYAWDFGDNASSSLANPSHTYDTPGSYPVSLTITDNQGATDSANLTITVNLAAYAVTLSNNQAGSGGPGETVTYTLQVTNTGNTADNYSLNTAVSGAAWVTHAPAATGQVAPGQSAVITVSVTIPELVADGDSSTATITATSLSDAGVFASADLTTTALGQSGLALDPVTASAMGLPGSTVNYTLTVTNTGQLTATFEISASAVWEVSLSAASLNLSPGESALLTVNVTIPSSAALGEQDSALIVVQSALDPGLSRQAVLTTTAASPVLSSRVFLPLAIKGPG